MRFHEYLHPVLIFNRNFTVLRINEYSTTCFGIQWNIIQLPILLLMSISLPVMSILLPVWDSTCFGIQWRVIQLPVLLLLNISLHVMSIYILFWNSKHIYSLLEIQLVYIACFEIPWVFTLFWDSKSNYSVLRLNEYFTPCLKIQYFFYFLLLF